MDRWRTEKLHPHNCCCCWLSWRKVKVHQRRLLSPVVCLTLVQQSLVNIPLMSTEDVPLSSSSSTVLAMLLFVHRLRLHGGLLHCSDTQMSAGLFKKAPPGPCLGHAGAAHRGGTHLGQHLVQPLEGAVEMQLDPAGGAGDRLPSVLCSPALNEAHSDGAHPG